MPLDDRALLVVYREEAFTGSAVSHFITADSEVIGGLKSGTYFFHYFRPGIYVISEKSQGDTSLTLQVEAGKTYYLEAKVDMADPEAKIDLLRIEEKIGADRILALQFAVI